jgi:hypothetical protein
MNWLDNIERREDNLILTQMLHFTHSWRRSSFVSVTPCTLGCILRIFYFIFLSVFPENID